MDEFSTHIPEPFTFAGGVLIHPSWTSSEVGPAANEPKGERVGDYVLMELLGSGATAEVWWALDVRLRLAVALKIFRPEADRFDVDQVLQEARAASQIVSDHVVGVKAAGELPDGRSFIAMDLCADVSEETDELEVARDLNEVTPVSTDEALRWMVEAARGVHDAHRVRVFHRDIKPGNLLCRPGKRSVHLTDFGLAVHARSSVAGTPPYMAPEQAFGLPRVDPDKDSGLLRRIDVYGLGATTYALLAGHSPFEPHDGCSNEAMDMLEQVRAGPPPALRSIPTRLPVTPRIERVVAKAMARESSDRYATALELAADLVALREYRPTSVDRGPLLHLALWLRREWRKVSTFASIAVLFGSLVVGVVQARWLRAELGDLQVQQHHAVTAHARALGRLHAAELAAGEAEASARDASASATSSDQRANAASRRARTVEREAGEAVATASEAQAGAEVERDGALVSAAAAVVEAEESRILAAEALALSSSSAAAEAEAHRAVTRLEQQVASVGAEVQAARASAEAWEGEAGGLRDELAELEGLFTELERRSAFLVAENQRLRRVQAQGPLAPARAPAQAP